MLQSKSTTCLIYTRIYKRFIKKKFATGCFCDIGKSVTNSLCETGQLIWSHEQRYRFCFPFKDHQAHSSHKISILFQVSLYIIQQIQFPKSMIPAKKKVIGYVKDRMCQKMQIYATNVDFRHRSFSTSDLSPLVRSRSSLIIKTRLQQQWLL